MNPLLDGVKSPDEKYRRETSKYAKYEVKNQLGIRNEAVFRHLKSGEVAEMASRQHRRHDGGDHDGAEGADAEIAENYFDGEHYAANRSVEHRRKPRCRATTEQRAGSRWRKIE